MVSVTEGTLPPRREHPAAEIDLVSASAGPYGWPVDLVLSWAAALAATGFSVDLVRSWRARPRPHVALWAAGIAAYAIATSALAVGLGVGWSETTFKVFYYFGAIATIPLLAAGSVMLVFGRRPGRIFLAGVLVWIGLGAVATLATPISGVLDSTTVPAGSEVFDFTVEIGNARVPGPRLFAAVSGGVGTVVLVGLAVLSVVRFWRKSRHLALANVLIVLGVLAPATGGTFTAIGEAAALALSLLVGAVLLWLGFRLASSASAPAPVDGSPARDRGRSSGSLLD
jgi:hypothetical protein